MQPEHNEIEPERVAAIVAAIRDVSVPAPERLRRTVEEAVAQAERRPRGSRGRGFRAPARSRWRVPALAGAALGALALVLVIGTVLLVSDGGSPAPPTAREAAAVALRPATSAAPANAGYEALDASIGGTRFPDWSEGSAGGWRASGARTDQVAGRDVRTVFYENDRGARIGYAIAAAPALPAAGGRVVNRGGVPMRIYDLDGATAVVWLRNGQTCIVAGRGVAAETLLERASASST